MQPNIKSLRPFIGAKNMDESLEFYKAIGWDSRLVLPKMYYVSIYNNFGFYLQDYYNADWVNNTQVFVEMEDVEIYYKHLESLLLSAQFDSAHLKPMQKAAWGTEFFLLDPSSVLWHFGKFA